MKKLILMGLALGLLAGGFFAFRWFRGETGYEQAVEDLDQGPALQGGSRQSAVGSR